MSLIEVVDYIDADVAYLLGLITARGKISESGSVKQIIIEFPYQSLKVDGVSGTFDTNTSIRLGLQQIQERILELTGADVSIASGENSVTLVLRFLRNTMVWRNILMHTQEQTGYEYFRVPEIFFSSAVPNDWKREYLRGFADVAGNVRRANRYIDDTNRVRLDVLNYPTNWNMPVQLCTLLEEHLTIPVQLITWGHPNLGRDFREHQINIFAVPFENIGFSLPHKQAILEEFIKQDRGNYPQKTYKPCPGRRKLRKRKPKDKREISEKLDERLNGKHFNAYWQICKKLGCPRTSKILQQKDWQRYMQNASEESVENEI
ncbi:MAG: hypothetical protein OXI43_01055 [Candidatus Poribacteria bacterium]|nr:hypothetical protein [Candidatus Poribacteria bacterium]